MAKKLVNFRFEKVEIERLKNLQRNYGFSSLSAFVRDKLLKDDLTTKKLVEEIHSKIVKNKGDSE